MASGSAATSGALHPSVLHAPWLFFLARFSNALPEDRDEFTDVGLNSALREELINRGCLVINNLSLHGGSPGALLAACDVPRVLEQAIATHPKEPVVQESARGILRRLGRANPQQEQ